MTTPSKTTPRVRCVELRKGLDLTQEKLSERSGVSQSAVSRYEKGEHLVRESEEAIARVLNTSVAYLDGTTDDASPPQDDEPPALEAAIMRALDKTRHTLADARAVEDVMKTVVGLAAEIVDVEGAARAWLDAAASLRKSRTQVTQAALLLRVTNELVARSVDLNHAGDAALQRLGGHPPAEPVKIQR